jgi:hypothetical protein
LRQKGSSESKNVKEKKKWTGTIGKKKGCTLGPRSQRRIFILRLFKNSLTLAVVGLLFFICSTPPLFPFLWQPGKNEKTRPYAFKRIAARDQPVIYLMASRFGLNLSKTGQSEFFYLFFLGNSSPVCFSERKKVFTANQNP